MGEAEWRARLVQTVAQQVRRRRLEMGLSVQKLADICTEQYDLPIKRSVLANFEGGRRPALSVVELLVLARILAIPPAELLFPVGRDDTTEVLPDTPTDPWAALKWFTGETDRLPDDDEATQDATTVGLYRDHERLLGEWWANRRKLERILATSRDPELRKFRSEADPVSVDDHMTQAAADAMRRVEEATQVVRADMRSRGLTPPRLGLESAYIEPESFEGTTLDEHARAVAQVRGISLDDAVRQVYESAGEPLPAEQNDDARGDGE
ncbi:helix-turn-helix transcriptional regulator [Streptomyces phaeochromogenes]|uniref:helix-turn-helix domain-containing protein n=1 Tax=Streptomyces phaeochromogenes TaxID=1923 RepID=UPI0033BFCA4A